MLKGSVAGGAVYLVYDQGLLSTGDRSQVALRKYEEVVAPALYQAGQYVSDQTGLKLPQVPPPGRRGSGDGGSPRCFVSALRLPPPQLPALPKVNFHFRDSWDSGRARFRALGGPWWVQNPKPVWVPGPAQSQRKRAQ